MSLHFYQFLPHPSHKDKLEKISKMGIPQKTQKQHNQHGDLKSFKADVHPVVCVVIRLLFSKDFIKLPIQSFMSKLAILFMKSLSFKLRKNAVKLDLLP
jgi:hypothetical protein